MTPVCMFSVQAAPSANTYAIALENHTYAPYTVPALHAYIAFRAMYHVALWHK